MRSGTTIRRLLVLVHEALAAHVDPGAGQDQGGLHRHHLQFGQTSVGLGGNALAPRPEDGYRRRQEEKKKTPHWKVTPSE
jgi:hypothetical protein